MGAGEFKFSIADAKLILARDAKFDLVKPSEDAAVNGPNKVFGEKIEDLQMDIIMDYITYKLTNLLKKPNSLTRLQNLFRLKPAEKHVYVSICHACQIIIK